MISEHLPYTPLKTIKGSYIKRHLSNIYWNTYEGNSKIPSSFSCPVSLLFSLLSIPFTLPSSFSFLPLWFVLEYLSYTLFKAIRRSNEIKLSNIYGNMNQENDKVTVVDTASPVNNTTRWISFALHQFHSILFSFSFSAVSVGLSSSEVDNSTNDSPDIWYGIIRD